MLAIGADLGLFALPQAAVGNFGSAQLPVPGGQGLFGLLTPQEKITLTAAEAKGALPATGAPMLAYAATYKGQVYLNPVLVLRKGQPFAATLVNGLQEPTIIHWHGVDCPWKQAGHPAYAIAPNSSYEYSFPITNRAGTYWYHPHPHGLTAKQAYMGLASYFIVRDDEEEALASELDLRLGETDIPMVIQDKRLTHHGLLEYSPSRDDLSMGYLGDTILVNGQASPTLKTGTRLYRFRLLNASTARSYNLSFILDGRPLLGNDGGFLPAPQQTDGLFLSPGERADVLLDMSSLSPGQEVFLQNMPFDPMHNEGDMMAMDGMSHAGHGATAAPMNHASGGESHSMDAGGHGGGHAGHGAHPGLEEGSSYPIVRLLVDRAVAYTKKPPTRLPNMPAIPAGGTERPIRLAMNHMGGWTINDLTFDMQSAPIVVTKRGPEIWHVSNAKASMPHPMHLHGYFYRVLQRSGSPEQVKSRAIDAHGRLATDLGYKDTVLVWPGETVSLSIDFSQPQYPGEQLFLFHCHNLEHEDQGMMLNVKVV